MSYSESESESEGEYSDEDLEDRQKVYLDEGESSDDDEDSFNKEDDFFVEEAMSMVDLDALEDERIKLEEKMLSFSIFTNRKNLDPLDKSFFEESELDKKSRVEDMHQEMQECNDDLEDLGASFANIASELEKPVEIHSDEEESEEESESDEDSVDEEQARKNLKRAIKEHAGDEYDSEEESESEEEPSESEEYEDDDVAPELPDFSNFKHAEDRSIKRKAKRVSGRSKIEKIAQKKENSKRGRRDECSDEEDNSEEEEYESEESEEYESQEESEDEYESEESEEEDEPRRSKAKGKQKGKSQRRKSVEDWDSDEEEESEEEYEEDWEESEEQRDSEEEYSDEEEMARQKIKERRQQKAKSKSKRYDDEESEEEEEESEEEEEPSEPSESYSDDEEGPPQITKRASYQSEEDWDAQPEGDEADEEGDWQDGEEELEENNKKKETKPKKPKKEKKPYVLPPLRPGEEHLFFDWRQFKKTGKMPPIQKQQPPKSKYFIPGSSDEPTQDREFYDDDTEPEPTTYDQLQDFLDNPSDSEKSSDSGESALAALRVVSGHAKNDNRRPSEMDDETTSPPPPSSPQRPLRRTSMPMASESEDPATDARSYKRPSKDKGNKRKLPRSKTAPTGAMRRPGEEFFDWKKFAKEQRAK